MLKKERVKEYIKLLHSLEISWQVYLLIFLYLLIMVISIFFTWKITLLLAGLFFLILYFLYREFDNVIGNINAMANDLSDNVRQVGEDSMYRAPIAILLYDAKNNYRIRWVNPIMQHIFTNVNLIGQTILTLDDDFKKLLAIESDRQWHIVEFKEKFYKVLHQKDQGSLYLFDVTEEMLIKEQRKLDQLVFGYLFLDDFDEIIESMDDVQSTSFESMVINDLSEWTNKYGIYSKRIDDEKFLLLLNQQILDRLEKDKFKYFEELKEINLNRNTPLSISIGIAYPDSDTYNIDQLSEQAQLNLDLALGRGGDQIVVKSEGSRARFYGGKTNPSEKRTNIRSRLIFQALKTSIEQADNILIAGHKRPDMDSIGASIGIYKIVRLLKKHANIIINEKEFNNDVRELLSMKEASFFWDREILVDIKQSQKIVNDKTLIIMVDHHRPTLSEAEPLLDQSDVVIIDHHRRGEEFPDNTVLSYIEPYASSTSELVTEFFMNIRNTTESLNRFEATALLAGVIIDTNNFSLRTGSRTFDVASYLKSRGADSEQIQRLMKEDIDVIIQRNKLIERAEYFEPYYAITLSDDNEIIDNITAAQAADILLDVNDVEASFVIYRRSKDEIGISARSLGLVNVQTIMERLGGGGHLSNAATQISNSTIEEVYQNLLVQLREE